jgi:hypothetical protein
VRKRHLQGKAPSRPCCAPGNAPVTNLWLLRPRADVLAREAHPSRAAVRGVYRKFGLDEEQAADDEWLGAALDNVQGSTSHSKCSSASGTSVIRSVCSVFWGMGARPG